MIEKIKKEEEKYNNVKSDHYIYVPGKTTYEFVPADEYEGSRRNQKRDADAAVSASTSDDVPSARQFDKGYRPYSSPEDTRTTFQIHGQDGPHSYRFGYDTGKGSVFPSIPVSV